MGYYNQYKTRGCSTQSAKVSTCYTLWHFGDKSLITGWGGGGLQNSRAEGKCSFTLTKNGGGKSFSCAEGGAQKVSR